ncbi:MAG: hypothetical protein NTY48_03760 [Candidatus Diapherotrites archaeon]|nr:hypothetical protein [Candidatus Diapherotrites archaeon]
MLLSGNSFVVMPQNSPRKPLQTSLIHVVHPVESRPYILPGERAKRAKILKVGRVRGLLLKMFASRADLGASAIHAGIIKRAAQKASRVKSSPKKP